MLIYTFGKIGCDTRVQRSVTLVGEDVDVSSADFWSFLLNSGGQLSSWLAWVPASAGMTERNILIHTDNRCQSKSARVKTVVPYS